MKRKVGLLIGYNGAGYHGLQWNKNVHTIEKVVMEVLYAHGLVSDLNATDPQKIDMKSCSRTDKGVHAAFNMVNAKICAEPTAELETKLKAAFAEQGIHLYRIVRVPKKFIGYRAARSRIYRYSVPTFFLKESNYALECEERAAMDRRADAQQTETMHDMPTPQAHASIGNITKGAQEMVDTVTAEAHGNMEETDNGKEVAGSVQTMYKDKGEENGDVGSEEEHGGEDESVEEEIKGRVQHRSIYRNYEEKDLEGIQGYRSGDISLFRSLMEMYVGSHNFRNFTVKSNQKDAKRFIKSVVVSDPKVVDGVEYVDIEIHGQSFLLHQIRKMVSYAVLNARYAGDRGAANFEKAFTEEVHVPKAPAQYLYLAHVFFEDYNARAEEKIEVDASEQQAFENECILPAIYSKSNLYEWLKYFDAVRFHHHNLEIFN